MVSKRAILHAYLRWARKISLNLFINRKLWKGQGFLREANQGKLKGVSGSRAVYMDTGYLAGIWTCRSQNVYKHICKYSEQTRLYGAHNCSRNSLVFLCNDFSDSALTSDTKWLIRRFLICCVLRRHTDTFAVPPKHILRVKPCIKMSWVSLH